MSAKQNLSLALVAILAFSTIFAAVALTDYSDAESTDDNILWSGVTTDVGGEIVWSINTDLIVTIGGYSSSETYYDGVTSIFNQSDQAFDNYWNDIGNDRYRSYYYGQPTNIHMNAPNNNWNSSDHWVIMLEGDSTVLFYSDSTDPQSPMGNWITASELGTFTFNTNIGDVAFSFDSWGLVESKTLMFDYLIQTGYDSWVFYLHDSTSGSLSIPLNGMILDTDAIVDLEYFLVKDGMQLTLTEQTINTSNGTFYDIDGTTELFGSDRAGHTYAVGDSGYWVVASEPDPEPDNNNTDDNTDTPTDYFGPILIFAILAVIFGIATFATRYAAIPAIVCTIIAAILAYVGGSA